ncbi:hypothetical protein [Pseudobacteriovorax antillogorgiicola]|uniref:Phosphohistidine swiveling domain-containing protein n=1 Tax=Pseudobacteriovorax antillogorgiicola TaxID=1513793 RepID=A0A1Y6CMY9_9BACT|nr:hypothetical protein [Pseudobacteriovorax antillogorgiicola]TCS47032.1 phosphohistidine swiveling domain-containing protein [Pseudobacteriovorax antillogorgiicola]SMF65306.1 Phosphohistidine swiveling domain-containing protein [Pseudobacteriovorax antillogorgiicola]
MKLISSQDLLDYHLEDTGFKALRLQMAALTNSDQIPTYWCLTGSTCLEILEESANFEQLVGYLDQLQQDSQREVIKQAVEQIVMATPLPEALANELNELLDRENHLVVRSSSAQPHRSSSCVASFISGEFTKLQSAILQHIACELVENGMPFMGSLILQRYVSVDKTMIVFTANPHNGNRSQAVMEHYYGSKKIEDQIDYLEYNWRSKKIEVQNAGMKTRSLRYDANGREISSEVSPKFHLTPILEQKSIDLILKQSFAILKQFSKPLRLHFASSGGRLYLLGIKKPAYFPAMRDNSRHGSTWSNDNLETSYLGLTSPLSFSVNRHLYQSKLTYLLNLFKADPLAINTQRAKMQHVLSMITCRIFSNKTALSEIAQLVPHEQDRALLESFLTLGTTNNQPDHAPPLLKKLRAAIFQDVDEMHLQAQKKSQDFAQRYRDRFLDYTPQYFATHNVGELFSEFEDLLNQHSQLHHSQALVRLEAFKVGLKIQGISQEAGVPMSPLELELSMQLDTPTFYRDFLDMAREFSQERIMENYDFHDPQKLFHHLAKDHQKANHCFRSFIQDYGFLSFQEGKFNSVTVAENPAILLPLLHLYCQHKEVIPPMKSEPPQQKILNELFHKIHQSQGPSILNRLRKKYQKFQQLMVDVQHIRIQKLQFFMLLKQVVSAIGYQLHDSQFIENPTDIHYFLMEEFEALELGGFLDKDIKDLISKRKEEYQAYQNTYNNIREFQITEFIPVTENVIEKFFKESPKPWGRIHGQGNHAGSFNGNIKKIHSPEDFSQILNKIVLLQVPSNLASLAVPLAKGIIVEQCSHSSYLTSLSNMLQRPMVTNVPRVFQRVSDQQPIHIDSDDGAIEKMLNAAQDDDSQAS